MGDLEGTLKAKKQCRKRSLVSSTKSVERTYWKISLQKNGGTKTSSKQLFRISKMLNWESIHGLSEE